MGQTLTRCGWARGELLETYHDREWGVPVHDDRTFFEFLVLEGAQAGLSWETVLRKREGYRAAFAGFDIARVAKFDERRAERLRNDARIVRNGAKIRSAIGNARAALEVQREFGSLDAYFWSFTGGEPIVNRPRTVQDLPARTELSDRLSRDLKARGFAFVGSTIVYAFMQATGLVDDHLATCFRALQGPRATF